MKRKDKKNGDRWRRERTQDREIEKQRETDEIDKGEGIQEKGGR